MLGQVIAVILLTILVIIGGHARREFTLRLIW